MYDYEMPITVTIECEECGETGDYVIPSGHYSWMYECCHCPAIVWPSRADAAEAEETDA